MRSPFKRIKKLGTGTFGEVWLAERGSRLVAVKLLRHQVPDSVERFAREVRILRELTDHPHVVTLIDQHLAASTPYFVMEYCEGGSLRPWVDERRPWREAMTVLEQALVGVMGIHDRRGFHRDLKPENLLLTRVDGLDQVKVCDLGLAQAPMEANNMTLSPQGTRGYMAPEIALGGDFHAGADIYSLGIVGIELLTGSRDPLALAAVEVPGRLKELLRRMVARDPARRPAIERAVAALSVVLLRSRPTRTAGRCGELLAWLHGKTSIALNRPRLTGSGETTPVVVSMVTSVPSRLTA